MPDDSSLIYIQHDMQQLNITPSELNILLDSNDIYYCPDCEAYHISDGSSWDRVERAILWKN